VACLRRRRYDPRYDDPYRPRPVGWSCLRDACLLDVGCCLGEKPQRQLPCPDSPCPTTADRRVGRRGPDPPRGHNHARFATDSTVNCGHPNLPTAHQPPSGAVLSFHSHLFAVRRPSASGPRRAPDGSDHRAVPPLPRAGAVRQVSPADDRGASSSWCGEAGELGPGGWGNRRAVLRRSGGQPCHDPVGDGSCVSSSSLCGGNQRGLLRITHVGALD
jgi:hypothetical protein